MCACKGTEIILTFHFSQMVFRYFYNLSALEYLIVVLFLLSGLVIQAAPYPSDGKPVEWAQADGTVVQLRVFGDEFYARTETEDGYTVVYNATDCSYYYGELSGDKKSLVAGSHLVGEKGYRPAKRHLSLPKEVEAQKWGQRKDELLPDEEAKWAGLVKEAQARRGKKGRGPEKGGSGQVQQIVGITILVQFPDDPGTGANDPVPFPTNRVNVDRFCNELMYSGGGNSGSVRDYFVDQSLGKLIYTQEVPAIVTLPFARNWYNFSNHPTNTSLRGAGEAGRLVVEHALTALKASGYDFSGLSTNPGGTVVATNVLFAGNTSGVWAQGLWPHRWLLRTPFDLGDGQIFASDYQITDAGTGNLTIGTFVHESGHLVLGLPDIYDTNGGSSGVGQHCLMGSGNFGNGGATPSPINGYFKDICGWAEVTDLTPSSSLEAILPSTGNRSYRIRKPGTSSEYFLIENRGSPDRWAGGVPDRGIMIWHIDERVVGNRNEQMTEALHYQVSLEQADGRFDLENDRNRGDASDLYSSGSRVFNDRSLPDARWWDGSESGIVIEVKSPVNPDMVVKFGDLAPNSLRVDVPNGGEVYAIGGTVEVHWSETIPGNVSLELYQGGELHSVLSPDEANDGVYEWVVPDDLAVASNYTLRVSSVVNGNVEDFSDRAFSLVEESFPPKGRVPEGWAKTEGADQSWEVSYEESSTGVASLSNEAIGDLRSASIEVSGGYAAGELSFWVKVSSEADFDFFRLYIDGQERLELSGEVRWQRVSFPVSAGAHRFEWRYSKDVDTSSGKDGVWIDEVVLPPQIPANTILVTAPNGGEIHLLKSTIPIQWGANLSGDVKIELYQNGEFLETLGEVEENDGSFDWLVGDSLPEGDGFQIRVSSVLNPSIDDFSDEMFTLVDEVFPEGGVIPDGWISSGTRKVGWEVSSKYVSEGGRSIRSGKIDHLQRSYLRVEGDYSVGVVSFKVKVSAANSLDKFQFFIDGVEQVELRGEQDWREMLFPVTVGEHTFEWRYEKTGAANEGSALGGEDGVWIDEVVLPDPFPEDGVFVSDPRDGEFVLAGRAVTVSWLANFTGRARLELYQGDVFHSVLSESELNDGVMPWVVGRDITNADNYRIRVSSLDFPEIEGFTPIGFAIGSELFPQNGIFPEDWVEPVEADAGWELSSEQWSEGGLSLTNELIGDSEAAAMRVTRVFGAGNVTFQVRVSSQFFSDRFVFLIDGEEKVSLYGEVSWTPYSFPLTPGEHTLEWRYEKDDEASSGDDRAWIDFVRLPMGPKAPGGMVLEYPLGTPLRDEISVVPFGEVRMGGDAEEYLFTIRNTGAVPIRDITLSVDGVDGSAFQAQGLSSNVLGAQGEATFTLSFLPTREGDASGTLRVISEGDVSAAFDVILEGLGSPPDPAGDWRMEYFGIRENTGIAADDVDADGDGESNLDEYRAGTVPTDPNDSLRVASMAWEDGVFVTWIDGKKDRVYELQRTDDLEEGIWSDVDDVKALSEDQQVRLVDPIPLIGTAFYRVRVIWSP